MKCSNLIAAIASVRDVFVENTRCCAKNEAVVSEITALNNLISRLAEIDTVSRKEFFEMVGEDKHGNAEMAWDIAND